MTIENLTFFQRFLVISTFILFVYGLTGYMQQMGF